MDKKRLGVLLDCSRNSVMNIPTLKDFVDKLKLMGYNTLMLYTEDTYEVKNEPLFGYLRGRYTKEELKEIDRYCLDRGIELIPCIQTLAHLETLLEWEEYRKIKDGGNVLLVGCDRTYELLDNIFSSLRECFTTKSINVSMDEAFSLGRGVYLDKNGYRPRHEILAEHLNKTIEIAKKHGFEETMMWSDMYFNLGFGEVYSNKNVCEDVKNSIPEGVTIIYWDYFNNDENRYDEMLAKHKQLSEKVSFAGGAIKWIGFNSGNNASITYTKKALNACKKHDVKDVFITLWGDNGAECSPFAVLPSLFFTAQYANGNADMEDIKKKFYQTFGENFDDFMLCDMFINDKIHELLVRTTEKTMLYNDCFSGRFDSYISDNDTDREDYKVYRQKLIDAKNRSKNFKYIFDSYEKLCNVLTIKYDLGYRTKKAYQSNDIKTLKSLLKEYKVLPSRIEEFYKAFRTLWLKENKPHGFEITDIRLGGLIQRVKNCTERLQWYLSGKINEIPELAEPIQDYLTGGSPNPGVPFCNIYQHISSVNLL